MNDKIGPACIRCGLCCIAAPCNDFGNNVCKYLQVNEDLTTTCLNEGAVEALVGPGCFIRGCGGVTGPEGTTLHEVHCEIYNITEVKKAILAWQKGETYDNPRRLFRPSKKLRQADKSVSGEGE